ncbi:hypothetical protein BT63DRAFT_166432 [Microthyrium microscopicum]|uniref:Prion-inhibition and propagation HeLo domain-containing protein n=1 Tax=Microthyrium microscopicum TaxID=703497 RepID=A0A6A6US68_9PEZI|nr:hypothetical protein BT63DRAFT_166432 [Microthyrium microscopicum]
MKETPNNKSNNALQMAHLFGDCIESFGTFHQGKKEWDRPQKLLLTKLGIQQARLLAWGQFVGICAEDDFRDSRIDDETNRIRIETALKQITHGPSSLDKESLSHTYGLSPSKKIINSPEPALDSTRLEAFREQYLSLVRSHTKVATNHHWIITDNVKFQDYINKVRGCVDDVIEAMDNNDRINRAVQYDIKAMGWHPVFDRNKAANDGSKLRLIKDSCQDDYPEFSATTDGALAYLNKQWQDSYQEAMERFHPLHKDQQTSLLQANMGKQHRKSELSIPSRTSEDQATSEEGSQKRKRPSVLSFLRVNSWKKRQSINRQTSLSTNVYGNKSDPHNETVNLPERSKSDGAVQSVTGPVEDKIVFTHPFGDELTKPVTNDGKDDHSLHPVTSMISRRDQIDGFV